MALASALCWILMQPAAADWDNTLSQPLVLKWMHCTMCGRFLW